MTSNSKTNCSERSAAQRLIDLQLEQSFQLPSEFDNTEFLVVKSGFYDKYIMPELKRKVMAKEQAIGG